VDAQSFFEKILRRLYIFFIKKKFQEPYLNPTLADYKYYAFVDEFKEAAIEGPLDFVSQVDSISFHADL
jgi:hypothetical protein